MENPAAEKVAPVEITTDVVPFGYKGDDYSTHITVKGGSGAYRFSGISLPSSLTLTDSGELTGRLTMEPGLYAFQVTAADEGKLELKSQKTYSLTVYPPLSLSSDPLVPGISGLPYHGKIVSSGGSDKRIVSVGHVPTGLSVDKQGNISGTPTAKPGQYTIHAEVTDVSIDPDRHVSHDYRFVLYPPLGLSGQILPKVLSPGPCNIRIAAKGGSGDYAFTLKEPLKGLVLSPSGKLTGDMDLKRGIYPLHVTIEDLKAHQIIEKKIDLTVIDFLPDKYEAQNDNDFNTGNTLKPDGKSQYHTFNEPGDRDFIRIDLTETPKDSVIHLKTEKGTRATPVMMAFYGPDKKLIQEKKGEPYPILYFRCEKPGIYFAEFATLPGETGDVTVSVKSEGPGIRLKTRSLATLSRYQDALVNMETAGGSGSFTFSATGLPAGLAMSDKGRITGRPVVEEGVYPVKIHVTDTVHQGIYDEKEFTLTVVDFFPDIYETNADHDFNTRNVMKPGDPVQNHTFNTKGDVDMVRLDLTGTGESHVIHVETLPLAQPSIARITVFKDEKQILETTGENGKEAGLYLECGPKDRIFVRITEPENRTGEYALRITDKGEKVRFKTHSVPDALTKGPYSCEISAEKGSGHYRFSATGLPGKLTMDEKGLINGDILLAPGKYPFSVTVTDLDHTGMSGNKEFVLTVVEFFPDEYEKNNDNDFNTSTLMKPGDTPQHHTFHEPGDVDTIRLDLRECKANDVIMVICPKGPDWAEAVMELYDPSQKKTGEDKRENRTRDLKIVFCIPKPSMYYVKMTQAFRKPGEYQIHAVNCGPKVELPEAHPPMAESDNPYTASLAAKGGSGAYTYCLSTGSLPVGLRIDPSSGTVTGKNTSWGESVFFVTATDNVYPENSDTKEYRLNAFMGKKLTGTGHVVFPHYVSGTFSMDSRNTTTTAFPGKVEGGTKGNLRYKIKTHTIPEDRFDIKIDALTGELAIKERRPVSCDQYINTTVHADIEVTDYLHTNNTFTIRYEIPVRCLAY